MKLLLNAFVKYLCGLLLAGLLLFLPAGTLRYPGGLAFLMLLFIPMLILGVALFVKEPALLKKRLKGREGEKSQRKVVGLSALMFLAGFVLAGLDYRFGWSHLPDWLIRCASILLLVSYALYGEVLRENTWLSRTVEVQENQTVVDTGLYGIVRHPMYAVTTALFLSMPLVMGSFWSFLVFLVYPALLVKRIRNEEQLLLAELPGYDAYCRKVRWRMFPGIW